MNFFRVIACVLMLVLFSGCANLSLPEESEAVETVDEDAIAKEMAEIEAEKQAAKEKVREEREKSSSEAKAENTIGDSDSQEQLKADSDTQTQVTEPADAGQSQVVSPEPAPTAETLRFRNKKLLEQHYNKHGIEMGFGSAQEYEAAAARVVSNPGVMHKTEKEDGDDVYYVLATNEFVVVSTDGYIRTYFLPDSGIKYYNKQ